MPHVVDILLHTVYNVVLFVLLFVIVIVIFTLIIFRAICCCNIVFVFCGTRRMHSEIVQSKKKKNLGVAH